jgi:hypothetical protein
MPMTNGVTPVQIECINPSLSNFLNNFLASALEITSKEGSGSVPGCPKGPIETPKQYRSSGLPVSIYRQPHGNRVTLLTISITCSTSSIGKT